MIVFLFFIAPALLLNWLCPSCSASNVASVAVCASCDAEEPVGRRVIRRRLDLPSDRSDTASMSSQPSLDEHHKRRRLPRDNAAQNARALLHTIVGDVSNRLPGLSVRPSSLRSLVTGKSLGFGVFRDVATSGKALVAEFIGEVISNAESDARRERGLGGYSCHYCDGFVLWCRTQAELNICIASRINSSYKAVDSVSGLPVPFNCQMVTGNLNGVRKVYVRTTPRGVPADREFVLEYGSLYNSEEFALPHLPFSVTPASPTVASSVEDSSVAPRLILSVPVTQPSALTMLADYASDVDADGQIPSSPSSSSI